MNRIEKREEIPKWLNKEQALRYIQKQGYKLSSSKLYKLSATDNIPCHRSGRNLYFFAEELDKWLNNQIEEEDKTSQNLSTQSIQLIIKSAQKRQEINNMNSNNIPMINHPYKTAKGLKRYVRDILKQVQQEETLKKIMRISI